MKKSTASASAGTACGSSSFAGFGRVDADIVYAKLAALAESAEFAPRRRWGRTLWACRC